MTFTTRALGLSVTVALALTACGGSGSGGSTAAPSGAASSAPTSAAPSAPEAGSTVTGTDLAGTLSTAMAASPNATVTFQVTGGDGLKGTGTVNFAADGSVLQVTVPQADSPDEPVTMIQTADAVYVDGATAGVTDGKKWARISEISDKGGVFTALFGLMAVATTPFTNPDGLLRALAATPSVTVKASDATTVTYTATLGPEAGVALFPASLFGDQKTRSDLAEKSTGDTAELTLVTDAQGRPTSVSYDVTSDGKPATFTADYSGWGSAETIPVPDPATVMEAAELDKQFTS